MLAEPQESQELREPQGWQVAWTRDRPRAQRNQGGRCRTRFLEFNSQGAEREAIMARQHHRRAGGCRQVAKQGERTPCRALTSALRRVQIPSRDEERGDHWP
jgi:hypothetical protein